MRGFVTTEQGKRSNFTIRHDYDYKGGSCEDGGKGYLVNVETRREKIAFCSLRPMASRQYAQDCMKMLSERRAFDGDEKAARWFMRER